MLRKFFNAIVLLPLAIVVVSFAVANRHMVKVSFDPINGADPVLSLNMPLFVVILLVGDRGRGRRRFGDLVPAAPLATRRPPSRGRCASGARGTR